MFNIPIDAWYAWIGLSIASIALIGAVSGLPATKPPDAAAVATTIDRVGAAEYPATAEHPVSADAIRLGTYRIGLKSDAGIAHATLAFGPITPVCSNSNHSSENRLCDVLYGSPPAYVFDSEAAFLDAVTTAQMNGMDVAWRPVDGPVVIRRVSWNNESVVLVGV